MSYLNGGRGLQLPIWMHPLHEAASDLLRAACILTLSSRKNWKQEIFTVWRNALLGVCCQQNTINCWCCMMNTFSQGKCFDSKLTSSSTSAHQRHGWYVSFLLTQIRHAEESGVKICEGKKKQTNKKLQIGEKLVLHTRHLRALLTPPTQFPSVSQEKKKRKKKKKPATVMIGR